MRVLNWAASPKDVLETAVDCLQHHGLVAFPTDTLYGLGVDALSNKAVRRLFRAKRRPLEGALPILVSDIQQATTLAKNMTDLALMLGSRYWPGALTIVTERTRGFRSLALAGGDSVALRVPNHDIPLALIRALGRPITGTSANRSGQAPPRTAADVAEQLDDDIDLVIDGGPTPISVESTVVDLRSDVPRLLREGAISREKLESSMGLRFETGER
jgi:L-threonylcarbamoyladenylate synthase